MSDFVAKIIHFGKQEISCCFFQGAYNAGTTSLALGRTRSSILRLILIKCAWMDT